MTQILILNGPNLNLLGHRQPGLRARDAGRCGQGLYGAGPRSGAGRGGQQSNHEGALVDYIHAARDGPPVSSSTRRLFRNTSIAILDALNAFDGPVLEVHISNIHKREVFRHHSYVSARAEG